MPKDPLDFARLSVEIGLSSSSGVELSELKDTMPLLSKAVKFQNYTSCLHTEQKCLNLSHENFSILYYCFLVHRDIHSHWFTFLSRKFVSFNESARISSSPVYLNGAIAFHFI